MKLMDLVYGWRREARELLAERPCPTNRRIADQLNYSADDLESALHKQAQSWRNRKDSIGKNQCARDLLATTEGSRD